jgi:hypothetical protein
MGAMFLLSTAGLRGKPQLIKTGRVYPIRQASVLSATTQVSSGNYLEKTHEYGEKMITVLHLDPITTALCLTAAAAVWTFLFLQLYREQQRRKASLARRPSEPARQWETLEAAAAAGAFSSNGQEKQSVTDAAQASTVPQHPPRTGT